MRRLLLATLVLASCSNEVAPDGGTGGGGEPAASLLGDVPVEDYCNTAGIFEFEIRARRVGCDPDQAGPCTLPSDPPIIRGDLASCPTSDVTRRMGVDVTEPGVYQVESVARGTIGEESVDCFAPVGTPMGGSPDVEVRAADIEAFAQIQLQWGPGPCPEP